MDKKEVAERISIIQNELKVIGFDTDNKDLKAGIVMCMQDLNFILENYLFGGQGMNKERRNRIAQAQKLLNQVRDIVGDIKQDEENAFENLSEGLQQTIRGETMEENVSQMEEALEHIDEALINLDEVE